VLRLAIMAALKSSEITAKAVEEIDKV